MEDIMEILECIKTRRSIRNYSDQSIDKSGIDKIIEAAIWAPSGKNGQPWKFKVITDKELINQISDMSIYGNWMKNASCFICVFLDKEKSYDYIKDVQSCGAAIQNILLCAHSLGIGSCWIGEILEKSEQIIKLLKFNENRYELMALVILGYKASRTLNPGRRDISSFLFEDGGDIG
jgi:nitroreductase